MSETGKTKEGSHRLLRMCVVCTFVGLLLVGLALLFWRSYEMKRTKSVVREASLPSHTKKDGRHLPGTWKNENPITAVDLTGTRVEVLCRELLQSQPGHISGKRAWDCLSELKSMGAAVTPVISALTNSTNVNERLFGVFLSLEVLGPSDSLCEMAAHDPAPVVPAEVGLWLYRNNKFDQWDDFLEKVSKQLTPDQTESLLNLCDRTPVSVEVPAGLSILRVGRGVPMLLREVQLRNSLVTQELASRILDPKVACESRLSMLDVMQTANPDGLSAVLTNLVSQSSEHTPLRFRGVMSLGEMCDNEEALAFLKKAALAVDDALAPQLAEAAAKAENRLIAGDAPLQDLERNIEEVITASDPSQKDNVTALLSLYVETIKQNRHSTPNVKLLLTAREVFKDNALLNFQKAQQKADIDYLLWRTVRPDSKGQGIP